MYLQCNDAREGIMTASQLLPCTFIGHRHVDGIASQHATGNHLHRATSFKLCQLHLVVQPPAVNEEGDSEVTTNT